MKSVVLIDDDQDVLEVISYALKNDGFEVFCFTDASLALQELKKMPAPGLVIVDYLMPEMNGLAFLDRARLELPDLVTKIPVALSSAMGKMEPAFQKLDGVIMLQKPMELEDLLEVARAHCRVR